MDPDELRSAIAANPQDPAERSRLINAAIENNMADEIPAGWGIGVNSGPDEPEQAEVFSFEPIRTEETDLFLTLATDGAVTIDKLDGRIVYAFPREPFWADTQLIGLEEAVKWAFELAVRPDELTNTLGERPVDPSNLLYTWKTCNFGPDVNVGVITVGLNQQFRVQLVFDNGEHYTLADDDILDAIDHIITLLQEHFEVVERP